jgi:RND family efflux transporter MFP subunit
MRPVVFALIVTTPLLAFLGACGTTERKVEAQANPSQQAPTVAVAKVVPQDLSRDIVLTAEFIPFQEVDVMAKVAGYVKQINVDVGDHVKQGQTLAVLEVPEMQDDMARAQAAVDQAQAEVARVRDEIRRAGSAHDIAHLSYQRLAGVVKERPGLVAQQEIDDAHSRDLVAEAQLAAANSNLAEAMQKVSVSRAEQDRVKTMFAYARVTAPFTGVITKRYANTGSMIQAGTASQTQAMPLVRLSENGLLRLILPAPESVVPQIHVGQQVVVKVPTLNRSFPGKVARFADRVQLATRTMDTEVDVPNPGLTLVPGMFAEVDLTTDKRSKVLTVPVTAVDVNATDESNGKVMAVSADGHLEQRDISLGLETANKMEVRSGLKEGDMVVIGSRSGLRTGQQVRPKLTDLVASNSAQ